MWNGIEVANGNENANGNGNGNGNRIGYEMEWVAFVYDVFELRPMAQGSDCIMAKRTGSGSSPDSDSGCSSLCLA